jgi:oligoribonuclease NrnB/cAMP/cGMP phosphodiesterase (DHH superfamily)
MSSNVPLLLQYISDRDLWKWEMKDSAAINAAISSYPRNFEMWDELCKDLSNPIGLALMKSEGEAIERAKQGYVHEVCKGAVLMDVAGYEVPGVNTTAHHSEVGHELLQLYPDAPFSATYAIEHEKNPDGYIDSYWRWSLRGRGDVDVSEIARESGGGGHPSAAGFRVQVVAFMEEG